MLPNSVLCMHVSFFNFSEISLCIRMKCIFFLVDATWIKLLVRLIYIASCVDPPKKFILYHSTYYVGSGVLPTENATRLGHITMYLLLMSLYLRMQWFLMTKLTVHIHLSYMALLLYPVFFKIIILIWSQQKSLCHSNGIQGVSFVLMFRVRLINWCMLVSSLPHSIQYQYIVSTWWNYLLVLSSLTLIGTASLVFFGWNEMKYDSCIWRLIG